MHTWQNESWRRLLEIAARVRADARATPSARSFAESVLDACAGPRANAAPGTPPGKGRAGRAEAPAQPALEPDRRP